MSKTMMASQLIYTSWPNGTSQKKGYMVYSKSEDITPEEETEIIAAFRYVAPAGLPYPPKPEDIQTLFPVMYGYVKLTSGRYVIAQSAYIGQDYTKRYGNYMIHAFVFDGPCSSFVLPLWGSSLFRRVLTAEELSAPKAPAPLEKIKLDDAFDVAKVQPYNGDKTFLAFLLEIQASALQSNKKMNVFVEIKDMAKVMQALYFCLGDSVKEKTFFTTFASGDPKLYNLAFRPKEQFNTFSSGMNPSLVNVSLANYKQLLPQGITPYTSFAVDLFAKDPARMSGILAELDTYVANGFVSNVNDACVLKKLKDGEFASAASWSDFVKYLPSLGKICPLAYLENAYSYAISHFSNEKLDIYEYFFPILPDEKKKEIFLAYSKENSISRFSAFLTNFVDKSAIASYAVSYLLQEAKTNTVYLENVEFKPILTFLLAKIAKEERQKLLSLSFKNMFVRQEKYFLEYYIPLIKKEMEADHQYALSLYHENDVDAKSYPMEIKAKFNEFFYPYVGDIEKKDMWSSYINKILQSEKNVSLEKLLDSKFGDRKDGIAIMEKYMDSFIGAYKKDHPNLILDLELDLLSKKDNRYLNDVRDYYLENIKSNQYASFLDKVKPIGVSLKKELYQSPLKDRQICKDKLNITPQGQFNYISLLVKDSDLSDVMPYWDAFFLLEELFPANVFSLENRVIEEIVHDAQFAQKVKKDVDSYPRAKDIFGKIQVKQFEEAPVGSVDDLVRRYKNDILNNRLLDQEAKDKSVSILLDKLSKVFSSTKALPDAAMKAYVELKDFTMANEQDKKRFLTILKSCFDNASIGDVDRLFGKNSYFDSLAYDLDKASIQIDCLTLVREGQLFKKKNKTEIMAQSSQRKFLYLNKSVLAPYFQDFCNFYLEDILSFYFDGVVEDSSADRLVLYVFPFMEYKKFDKMFESMLEKKNDAVSLILGWIDYESTSHDSRMKRLLEAVDLYFKSMDKKKRAEVFNGMKETKRPSVLNYVENYEKSHKGFFARLFGR